MSKELALSAKTRGNDAFTKGDFPTAVTEFTEAIAQDPTDAVFYSNRSGAYASMKKFEEALTDANKCVELRPSFVKGYSRQGVAHFGLSQLDEAAAAYDAGLLVDPTSETMKTGLTDVATKKSAPKENPLGSLFGPDMWGKLNANPTTRQHMSDPTFVAKLQQLQSNPNAMSQMMTDPRMSQALGVILGMGTEGFSAMNGDQASAPGGPLSGARSSSNGSASVEDDADMEDSDDDESTGAGASVKDETKKSRFKHVADMTPDEAKAAREASFKAAGKEMPKELTEEEKAELAAKQQAEQEKKVADAAKAKIRGDADKEKNLGNAAYKLRDFPTAIAKYESAITTDPTNIVYYTNLSAVYMETKEYQTVIDTALKGIAVGKEQVANYADVAKAYTRVGCAYQAMGNLDQAAEYFDKSLLEDYNDKTKILLRNLEDVRKKQAAAQYIDPIKSEEHKQEGNVLYNAGKFADAIPCYTEALKRDPSNYKVYSNRAACFTKMMEWGRGLQDCEKCIEMDPKFIKAYIRKGKIQHFLKQYHKALSTFDQALTIEVGNSEVLEAKRATMIAIQNSESDPDRAKEAMKDPEIQAILRDPTISKVLQDMQESPQIGQAAMRDPEIRKKIERLIAAGVLGVK